MAEALDTFTEATHTVLPKTRCEEATGTREFREIRSSHHTIAEKAQSAGRGGQSAQKGEDQKPTQQAPQGLCAEARGGKVGSTAATISPTGRLRC